MHYQGIRAKVGEPDYPGYPDYPDVRRLAELMAGDHDTWSAAHHFERRAGLIRGLMGGSLDPADAVALTRPAVELLGLLVPVDGLTEDYLRGREAPGIGVTRADFEPCRRELLAVVAALLDRRLGTDPGRWLAAVARAGAWPGTETELIASVAGPEDRGREDAGSGRRKSSGRAPRWPRGVDASAVLLAMAPPGVVERFLDSCVWSAASRGILTRMLDRGPILPLFVDYALGELGTQAMFDAWLRNPVLETSDLRRQVLDNPADIELLQTVYRHRMADRALRIGCVRRAEAVGGFTQRFRDRLLSNEHDVPMLEPLLVSRDPELIHRLLKRINNLVTTTSLRLAGYATLARTAGPEPVWALEQERAGTLAKMSDSVRASMAAGTADPILAAADAWPVTVGEPHTELELGAPAIEPWPYTDLIREHVEGDPHRLRVVGFLSSEL